MVVRLDLAMREHGELSRAIAIGLLLVPGCHPPAPAPPRVAVDPIAVGPTRVERSPPSPSPVPSPPLRPFTWERVRVVGNAEKLDGPGLAAEAEPGERVALLAADGTTHVTTIASVDRDACEDDADPEECVGVWIAERAAQSGSIITFPGRSAAQGDDLVFASATLAVTGDTALPDPLPHSLEVRYFDALCEGGADERGFVLLVQTSSAGPHPLANVPALSRFRGRPQRVVTLRTAGRSLHFVTTAAVQMPRSRRMFDLPRRRREAFFVIEGEAAGARVLHEETRMAGRTINHDHTCELPVQFPIPWSVAAVRGEVFVLTRAGLDRYERWLLTPTGLQRAGAWTADVLELF